jgi:hypothetical protein
MLCSALLLSLSGCTGITGSWSLRGSSDKRQNLASAVDMIRSGLDKEARFYLERVIDDQREDGVTDEALFRLAILKINDGDAGGKSSLELLERLRNSYPKSVWTKQSAPLYSYVQNSKSIRNRERELNSLREKNLSLSKDVRDLRSVIDRLKALDLELEQKIRR